MARDHWAWQWSSVEVVFSLFLIKSLSSIIIVVVLREGETIGVRGRMSGWWRPFTEFLAKVAIMAGGSGFTSKRRGYGTSGAVVTGVFAKGTSVSSSTSGFLKIWFLDCRRWTSWGRVLSRTCAEVNGDGGVLGSDTLADEGSEGVEGVSSFGQLVGLKRRSMSMSLSTRVLAMSMIESSSFFMVLIRVTQELAHLMAVWRKFRLVGLCSDWGWGWCG